MKKGEFIRVSIPKVLTDQIDTLVKDKLITYTTRANFIEDAVRRHIEKTKKNLMEEHQHQDHMEAHNIK
jgi:metal-responsive CopG/Arc/MetJ family transcriptional regulator